MVWVVPVIIWLAAAPERPGPGRPAAVLTALLFWCAPVWWIPSGVPELHENLWQLLAGSSFFGWTIFILAGAAGILLWPRVTYRRIDQFPEQLPGPRGSLSQTGTYRPGGPGPQRAPDVRPATPPLAPPGAAPGRLNPRVRRMVVGDAASLVPAGSVQIGWTSEHGGFDTRPTLDAIAREIAAAEHLMPGLGGFPSPPPGRACAR